MSSRHIHTKEFSYKYAASIITAVSVGEKGATVSIKTKDGRVFDTNWPLDAFFNKEPSVGKWLVDGHFGERFVVTESELSKLGDETADERDLPAACNNAVNGNPRRASHPAFPVAKYKTMTVSELAQMSIDVIDEYERTGDLDWYREQLLLLKSEINIAYSMKRL